MITCNQCINLFITHDPKRRWGCRKFGFKSNISPKFEVKKETGMECAYFTVREKINKTQREIQKNG